MKFENIEYILVGIIILIQISVFARTFLQIDVFKAIIPEVKSLKISKIVIPTSDLERLPPTEILNNVSRYKALNANPNIPQTSNAVDGDPEALIENEHEIKVAFGEQAEVNIIGTDAEANEILTNILVSVNNYLIRNRGAATDFNLIKDIVERNTNAVEEEINMSVAVPLYLGLMGTMIGIVIGLFNMPDLGLVVDSKAKDALLNEGISLLIGGVKIAMIASFVGLLLTIINSGWKFKASKSLVEKRKNDLYTFVQIELLPIINQGLGSTLESLQRNLFKFNSEFTSNLRQLNGIFDSNAATIRSQKELLDTIDRAKVSEMTRYNVKVLQQLDVSVAQFEKFNSYLTNVTLFVENSQMIVNRANELLARTDNFRAIADNLDNKLNQSQELLNFLAAHFKKLEDHKEFASNAVADVGHAISKTFRELETHIQNSSEQVKRFTVDELELLRSALSESKTNLSNLEHLSTLKLDVSQFKNSTASQGERLKQVVEELNRNMARSIAVLEEIERGSLAYKAKGIRKSIRKIFTGRS